MSLKLVQQTRVNIRIDIPNNLKVKVVVKCSERDTSDFSFSGLGRTKMKMYTEQTKFCTIVLLEEGSHRDFNTISFLKYNLHLQYLKKYYNLQTIKIIDII